MGAGRAANGGQDPARADAENADAQPQDEPAGLGTAVQQPKTAGGGSRPADAVRNLTEPAPIAESELSPSAFSLPEFPAALLLQLKQNLHLTDCQKIAFLPYCVCRGGIYAARRSRPDNAV